MHHTSQTNLTLRTQHTELQLEYGFLIAGKYSSMIVVGHVYRIPDIKISWNRIRGKIRPSLIGSVEATISAGAESQ